MNVVAVILAGGRGTRMQSNLPKVLHNVSDVPMIVRVVGTCAQISPKKIVVVVNPETASAIRNVLHEYHSNMSIRYVIQSVPLGTADAVRCACAEYDDEDSVLILNGDMPLIQSADLRNLIKMAGDSKIAEAVVSDPTGYGRVLMDAGYICGIREEKDCTEEERQCHTVNAGIYVFRGSDLRKYIPKIQPNNIAKEYYLTSIVELMAQDGRPVSGYEMCPTHIRGVNTPCELAEANEIYMAKNTSTLGKAKKIPLVKRK